MEIIDGKGQQKAVSVQRCFSYIWILDNHSITSYHIGFEWLCTSRQSQNIIIVAAAIVTNSRVSQVIKNNNNSFLLLQHGCYYLAPFFFDILKEINQQYNHH